MQNMGSSYTLDTIKFISTNTCMKKFWSGWISTPSQKRKHHPSSSSSPETSWQLSVGSMTAWAGYLRPTVNILTQNDPKSKSTLFVCGWFLTYLKLLFNAANCAVTAYILASLSICILWSCSVSFHLLSMCKSGKPPLSTKVTRVQEIMIMSDLRIQPWHNEQKIYTNIAIL